MNSDTIRWEMEVLRRAVYYEIYLAAGGLFLAAVAAVLHHTGLILYGLTVAVLGIILCFASGTMHDKMNRTLVIVESEERKERKKEEKHARKQKTDKTDSS